MLEGEQVRLREWNSLARTACLSLVGQYEKEEGRGRRKTHLVRV